MSGHTERLLEQLREGETDDDLDDDLRDRLADRRRSLEIETMDSRELVGEAIEIDWGSTVDRGLVHVVTDHHERGRTLRVMVKTDDGTRVVTVYPGREDAPAVRFVGGEST